MSQLNLFENPDFPQIHFRPKRGLKRISFRFNREGELTVSYPKQLSQGYIQEQLQKQEDWILKHFIQIKAQQNLFQLSPGACFTFESLNLQWQVAPKAKSSWDGQLLQIFLPEDEKFWTKKQVEPYLRKALKPIAQAHFQALLNSCAQEMNVQYQELRISSAKTRWGSCSHDNKISISCYALFLPKTLQKHLIVHELCHVPHKNHGPAFKALLAKFSSDAVQKEKELRRYKIPIV